MIKTELNLSSMQPRHQIHITEPAPVTFRELLNGLWSLETLYYLLAFLIKTTVIAFVIFMWLSFARGI